MAHAIVAIHCSYHISNFGIRHTQFNEEFNHDTLFYFSIAFHVARKSAQDDFFTSLLIHQTMKKQRIN